MNRFELLADKFDVRELIQVYCSAVDRCDLALLESVYSETSWEDHGDDKCSGLEFARRIISMLRGGSSVSLHHLLGQSTIVVDGDVAHAETYFLATSRQRGTNQRESLNQLGGRYVDRLVRQDGRWKIQTRTCIRDWSVSLPVDHDWLGDAAFVQGSRSQNDPAYAVLQHMRPCPAQ